MSKEKVDNAKKKTRGGCQDAREWWLGGEPGGNSRLATCNFALELIEELSVGKTD